MAEKEKKISRKFVLEILGKASIVAAFLAETVGAIKAFVPKVLYEPPSKFKIGKPDDFSLGVTFDSNNKLFIIREGDDFHTISAICTHLNCIVDWKSNIKEFYCPCHGSKFSKTGANISGPAPRPLPWYALSLAPDGNLVVDSNKSVKPDYKFTI